MSDTKLNYFLGSGPTADRPTPSPPTPPSGPDPGYLFYDTDLDQLVAWDGAAWAIVGGSSLRVLTADPGSPVDDTWWIVRDGASPQGVALKARIGGVTFTIIELTL